MATKPKPRKYQTNIAIAPAEFINEDMAELGLTPAALAKKSGLSRAVIDDILAVRKPVDQKIAEGLEKALGPPAYMWIGLERNYQETKARLEALAPRRRLG